VIFKFNSELYADPGLAEGVDYARRHRRHELRAGAKPVGLVLDRSALTNVHWAPARVDIARGPCAQRLNSGQRMPMGGSRAPASAR
jgi:hypothetical protein